MDRITVAVKALLCLFIVNQVSSSPFFFPQPDCYQPNNDDSYDSYQGPSYQETIQEMLKETLRAIQEIVQLTVRVAKEELGQLSDLWLGSCDSGDSGSPENYPGDGTAAYVEDAEATEASGQTNLLSSTTEQNAAVTAAERPTLENKLGGGNTTSSSSSASGITTNATNNKKKTKITEITTLTTLVHRPEGVNSTTASTETVRNFTSLDVWDTSEPTTNEFTTDVVTMASVDNDTENQVNV